jgi:hypothetical protein
LLSRGFKIGDPPPGVAAYWVGWRNGGPGGGHTAGTIVDPTGGSINVEMGGAARSGQFGGRAAGAAGFPDRAWIAIASGDDPSKNNFGSGSSPFAGGSAAAAVTGPAVSAAPEPAAAASSSISVPSSISGLAGWGLSNLGAGIGKTGSGSDLSLFGNAAASAVSGQVSSALGVLGVSDTPGWLKGISQLVGGISIGGGGSSASPLAATSNFTGTPAPDGVHGTRAGQPPGPGVTYNIQARDTEDAFIKAQRVERERAAAKLDRF